MKGTKEFQRILQKNSESGIIKNNHRNNSDNIFRFKIIKSKNSGITLIALVVIIIVLLIIASISISILTGDNGIIKRSKESKEQHEIAGEKETLKLAVSEAYTEDAKTSKDKKVKVTSKTLKDVLDKEYADKVENTEETDNGVKTTFTESGRTYTVDTDGNVTENTENSGDSGESTGISAEDFPASEYGAIVDNYKPVVNTDVKWQVFYTGKGDIENGGTQFTDDDRIYLIATNYVEKTTLPTTANSNDTSTTKSGKGPNDGSYERTANFTNIVNDYAGSASIANTKLQKLNGKYYKYLTDNSTTSNYGNIKSVAYMMDTSIWGDADHNVAFMDNNWGEYVIGGPTAELMVASYKKKYPNVASGYDTQVVNKNGYKFTKDSGAN